MKLMFEAFDADLSGSLDKEEVGDILTAAGVAEDRKNAALDLMFKDGIYEDGLPWDVFRLWLRREGFADRKLGWQERVYMTLDEPGTSKVAMVIGLVVVSLIIGSVITFMMETLPSMKTQDHCQPGQLHCATNNGTTLCPPVIDSAALVTFETIVIVVFSIEYIIRLLCSPFIKVSDMTKNYDPVKTYLSFGFTKASTVDVKKVLFDTMRCLYRYLVVFQPRPSWILSTCLAEKRCGCS